MCTFTEPNVQSEPTFLTWKPQTSPDLPRHSGWINGDWNLFSQPLASLIKEKKKKKNQTFGAHKPFKLLIGINHAAGFNLNVRATHLAVEHNSCGPSFAKKGNENKDWWRQIRKSCSRWRPSVKYIIVTMKRDQRGRSCLIRIDLRTCRDAHFVNVAI